MDVQHQRQRCQDMQADGQFLAGGREALHALVNAVAHYEQGVEDECHRHVVEQQAAQ